jgi:hypothetical protein
MTAAFDRVSESVTEQKNNKDNVKNTLPRSFCSRDGSPDHHEFRVGALRNLPPPPAGLRHAA